MDGRDRHIAGMRRRRGLTAVLLSLALAATGVVANGTAAAREPAPPPAAQPAPVARDLAEVAPRWWAGTDFIITGKGDVDGYHLYVGWERERYVFRPLASIQPNGYDGDTWLGYRCVTGDGRYVVVNLVPGRAVNRAVLRDRGGLAYIVDIATGKVRPAVRGVAFKYHATGCGTGSDAVLLRHLDSDQRRTELVHLDAATGRTRRVATVPGQLTSPVPTASGVLALKGRAVVKVAQRGSSTPTVVSRVTGEPFALTAAAGGADLLVRDGPDVQVHELRAGKLRNVGAGHVGQVQLLPGLRGRNVAIGARRLGAARPDGPRLAERPRATPPGRDAVPRGAVGHAVGTRVEAVSAQGKVVLAETTVDSEAAADGHRGHGPRTRRTALFAADDGSLLQGDGPTGRARSTVRTLPSTVGGTAAPLRQLPWNQTPKCGVPRNNPRRQAYGPTPAQTRWAVEMAARNLLVGARGRPANHLGSQLAAYSPSEDFPVPTLLPAGGYIPPAVMNGVLAQESNYSHASWRTLRGSGGNTLIGDYYGSHYTTDVIDFSKADCGYGIAQVTTGMAAADLTISPNGKAKIAIDYAENIQAGLGILAKKWNQLHSAKITMNDSNPAHVENWYMALWAYNTGLNPQASTGNTSGCTPGPSCTDPDGNWGLGWTNNPMNPDYPPVREVFLRDSYADAERPSEWPYQERVLGWAETPIQIPWGVGAYTPAKAGPSGDGDEPITYPGRESFCNATNACDPAHDPVGRNHDFCTREDFHCWWHNPVTTPDCARMCARSPFTVAVDAAEPAGDNPWLPACESELGPNAVIVDDLNDPSANLFCPNRNWTTRGTFAYEVGTDPATGAPLGEIDFHQVATGFGSHTWMAGNRVENDPAHRVTGTWRPTALTSGSYLVKAHIPVAGASAGSAAYRITTADGKVHERVVDQHRHWNHWTNLGTFQLGSNAKVTLSNVTRDDRDGSVSTVAFDAVAFVPVSGRAVEEHIDAVAFFDENQDLDTDPLSRPVNSPLKTRSALYTWAMEHSGKALSLPACSAGPRSDCVMPNTRAAAQRWQDEVRAAGTEPVAHPRGQSMPSWLNFSNNVDYRPTSSIKPAAFDSDDASYKLRSGMRISYVVGADGKIVDGSAGVDYHQRSGDTHLPRFVLDFLRTIRDDYGIDLPNLTYSATNLHEYDHRTTTWSPQHDGIVPGRSYRHAGWKPVVTDPRGQPVLTGGSCVVGLFTSGGMIGYRPMIGAKSPSVAMEAWHQRLRNAPAVPGAVTDIGGEIYSMFFKYGVHGSLFGTAPPIWQELYVRACTDGSTETIKAGVDSLPMAHYSFMPDQYLYRNGRAVGPSGGPWPADPIRRGDFRAFTRIPGPPHAIPYGQCNIADPKVGGNPWDFPALPNGHFVPEYEPTRVRFCLNPRWESEPE